MKYVPLIARILIAAFFIVSGLMKLLNMTGTQAFMESAGLPMVGVGVIVAIIIELVAGVLVLLGAQTRVAAWVLALYVLVVTLVFHLDLADQIQRLQFMKNIAILGGLLLLAHFGAGHMSCDNHKKQAGATLTPPPA